MISRAISFMLRASWAGLRIALSFSVGRRSGQRAGRKEV
jgi:hypothetical protein